MIVAIDPGHVQSAYVVMGADLRIAGAGIEPNASVLVGLRRNGWNVQEMVVEMVESFGMAVGREVFETVYWIGRFCEAWNQRSSLTAQASRIYRSEVKLHLCLSKRAKDGNVRQALLDKLGPRGTKKEPGPTYGISTHMWSALAVGVTFVETRLRVKGTA